MTDVHSSSSETTLSATTAFNATEAPTNLDQAHPAHVAHGGAPINDIANLEDVHSPAASTEYDPAFWNQLGLALGGLVLSLGVWWAAWISVVICLTMWAAWGGSSRVDKSMASLFFHPVNLCIGSGGGMELELAAPGLAAVGRPLALFGACVWANAAGMVVLAAVGLLASKLGLVAGLEIGGLAGLGACAGLGVVGAGYAGFGCGGSRIGGHGAPWALVAWEVASEWTWPWHPWSWLWSKCWLLAFGAQPELWALAWALAVLWVASSALADLAWASPPLRSWAPFGWQRCGEFAF